VRCPRCRTENEAASICCKSCGAPIAFGDEAFASPLDRPIEIDRRAAGRSAPAARPVAPLGASRPPSAPAVAAPAPTRAGEVAPASGAWEMEPPARPRRMATARESVGELRLSALAPLQPPPRPPAAPAADRTPKAAPPRANGKGAATGPAPVPEPPRMEPIGRIAPPAIASPAIASPARAAPAEAGRDEPELDLEADVDAIEVHYRRAPAFRRIVASSIDAAIAGVFLVLLPSLGLDEAVDALTRRGGVLLPALAVVAVVTFAYQWLGVALMGATPGKRVMRLRVVGPDGRRPSFGRSALRAAFAIPSFLLLGLGPLLGLFTRSGRSLHDFGAGTYPVSAP